MNAPVAGYLAPLSGPEWAAKAREAARSALYDREWIPTGGPIGMYAGDAVFNSSSPSARNMTLPLAQRSRPTGGVSMFAQGSQEAYDAAQERLAALTRTAPEASTGVDAWGMTPASSRWASEDLTAGAFAFARGKGLLDRDADRARRATSRLTDKGPIPEDLRREFMAEGAARAVWGSRFANDSSLRLRTGPSVVDPSKQANEGIWEATRASAARRQPRYVTK